MAAHESSEWSSPRRRLDRLPGNRPFPQSNIHHHFACQRAKHTHDAVLVSADDRNEKRRVADETSSVTTTALRIMGDLVRKAGSCGLAGIEPCRRV